MKEQDEVELLKRVARLAPRRTQMMVQGPPEVGLVNLSMADVAFFQTESHGRVSVGTATADLYHVMRDVQSIGVDLFDEYPQFVAVGVDLLVNVQHIVSLKRMAGGNLQVCLPGGFQLAVAAGDAAGLQGALGMDSASQ